MSKPGFAGAALLKRGRSCHICGLNSSCWFQICVFIRIAQLKSPDLYRDFISFLIKIVIYLRGQFFWLVF